MAKSSSWNNEEQTQQNWKQLDNNKENVNVANDSRRGVGGATNQDRAGGGRRAAIGRWRAEAPPTWLLPLKGRSHAVSGDGNRRQCVRFGREVDFLTPTASSAFFLLPASEIFRPLPVAKQISTRPPPPVTVDFFFYYFID